MLKFWPFLTKKERIKIFIAKCCEKAMLKRKSKADCVHEFVQEMVDDKVDESIQGGLFEKCILKMFDEVLGYEDLGYTHAVHGLDGVLRDPNGRLTVFEPKAYDHGFTPGQLESTKRLGRQGGWLYIFLQAMRMLIPGTKANTPANAKIAREILAHLGRVRSLLVAINLSTMIATVYEKKGHVWENIEVLELMDLDECNCLKKSA